MKLSATVKEAVADAEIEISQEKAAQAGAAHSHIGVCINRPSKRGATRP